MRRVAALTLLPLIGAAPAPVPHGKITSIEVRLFDPRKADFTENVLKDGLYVGWNTFMLEGNAGYGSGDALVLVRTAIVNPSEACCSIGAPLTITARNKGKVLAQRRFTDIPTAGGEVTRALYLQNIGCAGDIVISAALEGQTKAARLHLECGE